nr:MAG TPA: hypothetical protein [Caudoviricetes sp.]
MYRLYGFKLCLVCMYWLLLVIAQATRASTMHCKVVNSRC